MPKLDATAKAAVEGSAFAPAFYIYLDLMGADGVTPDPLRITTFGADTIFSGTGDSDLDGKTFVAWGGALIDISDISDNEGGSDTLTVRLSGIVSMDADVVAKIGNKALWQGRLCRVWMRVYDESGVTAQGAVVALYTGYMSSVRIGAEPESQVIELSVEKHLSFYSQASNRSYLNQTDYDLADTSAAATMAASNGLRRSSGALGGAGGGGAGPNRGDYGRSALANLH